MKEIGILFQTDMVRATYREINPKTMTRRLRGLQELNANPGVIEYEGGIRGTHSFYDSQSTEFFSVRCPYGQPGDVLRVRETWAKERVDDGYQVIWKADLRAQYLSDDGKSLIGEPFFLSSDYRPAKWRPSIHIPAAYTCRYLRNGSVGVERVQDISDEDALAEGIPMNSSGIGVKLTSRNETIPRALFSDLWDSINDKPKPSKHNPYTNAREDCYTSYPWENIREVRKYRGKTWYIVGNPWVWVIGFELIENYKGIAA